MLYDLHLHSTVSDGQFTPTELMHVVASLGLTVVSLSDHDRIEGLEEAAEAALQLGIGFIPGVELSVDCPKGEMHMLGYGISLTPSLLRYLAEQQQSRDDRNHRILQLLRSVGLDITYEDVHNEALVNHTPGEQPSIGRPHFALALLRKGYVATVEEAFVLYLGNGKVAYADRERTLPETAIQVIHEAGGAAVLAHPVLLHLNDDELFSELKRLSALGLDGLEAFHSDHTASQQKTYSEYAAELGLLLTGGSDYHGDSVTPDIHIGYGRNRNINLTDSSIIDILKQKITHYQNLRRSN